MVNSNIMAYECYITKSICLHTQSSVSDKTQRGTKIKGINNVNRVECYWKSTKGSIYHDITTRYVESIIVSLGTQSRT